MAYTYDPKTYLPSGQSDKAYSMVGDTPFYSMPANVRKSGGGTGSQYFVPFGYDPSAVQGYMGMADMDMGGNSSYRPPTLTTIYASDPRYQQYFPGLAPYTLPEQPAPTDTGYKSPAPAVAPVTFPDLGNAQSALSGAGISNPTPIVAPSTPATSTQATGTAAQSNPVEQALINYVNAQTAATTAQNQAQQGFNIPTDVFPTSTSSSTSYTGLPPELTEALNAMVNQSSPMVGQYQNFLSTMASPSSFISAYQPVQKALVDDIINNMAKKGILSSSMTQDALVDAANNVPQAYLQNMGTVASALGSGAQLPMNLMNLGKVGTSTSQSSSTNPLAPYELMLQALGMT